MELDTLLERLKGCSCGKEHTFDVKKIVIEAGLKDRVGNVLSEYGFPKQILVVGDLNTLAVTKGAIESLKGSGFHVKMLVFDNLLHARVEGVREVMALCDDVQAIISIGTGSLNDICRVAAYQKGLPLCIFGTAPSMDGFASDTAPIIEDNFKTSWQARQPEVILADTTVLAAAPQVLKSAGFGDMIAKLVGLVDWKVSHLLIGEYYCPKIAAITEKATAQIIALADRVTENDEGVAGQIMESLILTGLAMKLAGCSRPASGAEHVISHYLECHKVIRGIWPEFHGQKVGVATLYCAKIYHSLADRIDSLTVTEDKTDWDDVFAHFDEKMHEGVREMNAPTVTDEVDVSKLQACLPEIAAIIRETLPRPEVIEDLLSRSGAYTTIEQIHVSPQFMQGALDYHSYMRHRLLITRLLPMLGVKASEMIAERTPGALPLNPAAFEKAGETFND